MNNIKIIDKKNQIKDTVYFIMNSDEIYHYLILKDNGLLYITDIEDCKKCIESNKYLYIGVITKTNTTNNPLSIESKLKELLLNF